MEERSERRVKTQAQLGGAARVILTFPEVVI
jgi:hypothetical protein